MSLRVMGPGFGRRISVCVLALTSAFGLAQERLTLDEALRLARQRNGTVRAAYLDVQAARSRVNQSLAAFLPTVTPSYRYNSSRRELATTTGGGFIQDEGGSSQVSASWRVLDSGQRQFTLLSGRRSEEATRSEALQTLRNSLFTVHQQYFDALRADQLERVAKAQVDRTQKILEQTTARVELGDAPKKDILQARADALNAEVEAISSRNRTVTAEASLKATIGWDPRQPLPELVASTEPVAAPTLDPLEDLVTLGLRERADLAAQRRRVEAQRFNVRRAQREAGITFGLDANFDQQITPKSLENRTLSFLVSLPLFDGGERREAARESRFNLLAQEAALVQSEREARADIEAAYNEVEQNTRRLEAAKLALEAARENYAAAAGAQVAGAQGTSVVTVAAAQVSLVTAESNYIEATYDYYISDVRLRLVTGRPVPGEQNASG
jgi:outer membrane protein